MIVRVYCPHPGCGKKYKVDESQLGRTTVCKACGREFTVTRSDRETLAPAADSDTGLSSVPAPAVELRKDIPTKLGRFEVRSRLGSGTFGAVYRAYDPVLEREVAVKVPRAAVLAKPEARARFLREPKAAGQLRHPNIVPVYDAGTDGDQYYIASAYIEGRTLEEVIADDRPDFRRAAQIVRDLAEALAYAHGMGVVHRDVKPANIMVDAGGQPMLMDFGLAHLERSEEKLTQDGSVMGTPAYMAPEQADQKSGEVGPAADQYSLGVILYELLCGRTPFCGPPSVVIYNAVHEPPERPREINHQVPRELEAICLKTMAKTPGGRYASCGELAADIQNYLTGEPIVAKPATLISALRKRVCEHGLAVSVAGMAMTLLAAVVLTAYMAKSAGKPSGERLADAKTPADNGTDSKRLNELTEDGTAPVRDGTESDLGTPPSAPARMRMDSPRTPDVTDPQRRHAAVSPEHKQRLSEAQLEELARQQLEQLKSAVARRSWREMDAHLAKLRSDFASTQVVRASAEFLDKVGLEISVALAWEAGVRKGLAELDSLVTEKDFARAYFALKRLRQHLRDSTRVQDAQLQKWTERVGRYDRLISENLNVGDSEETGEYVIVPARTDSPQWAQEIAAQKQRMKTHPVAGNNQEGVALFRVFAEDEKQEAFFVVRQADYRTPLPMRFYLGGGYSGIGTAAVGEFARVGANVPVSKPDAGASNAFHARVKVQALYHYSPELLLEFRTGEVCPAGDILLRRLPEHLKGRLAVTLQLEEGLALKEEKVRLQMGHVTPPNVQLVKSDGGDNGNRWSSPWIAPGQYRVIVLPTDRCITLGQDAEVESGKTTPVELSVYRQRELLLDWWFREGETGPWKTGAGAIRTGKSWTPGDAWGGHYQVIRITPWNGRFCEAVPLNCGLTRLRGFTDPDKTPFPRVFGNRRWTGAIKPGDAFALSRRDTRRKKDQQGKSVTLQGIIRFRNIEPVP